MNKTSSSVMCALTGVVAVRARPAIATAPTNILFTLLSPIALLFFNIGVEIGQLMFVAAVLGVIWGLWRLPFEARGWARAIPVYVIGTLATYWFMERVAAIVTAV